MLKIMHCQTLISAFSLWEILALFGLQCALPCALEHFCWAMLQEMEGSHEARHFFLSKGVTALHKLQTGCKRRKKLERLRPWLRNSPEVQDPMSQNNVKYSGISCAICVPTKLISDKISVVILKVGSVNQ